MYENMAAETIEENSFLKDETLQKFLSSENYGVFEHSWTNITTYVLSTLFWVFHLGQEDRMQTSLKKVGLNFSKLLIKSP